MIKRRVYFWCRPVNMGDACFLTNDLEEKLPAE